jgi:5-formyltetrahydrofolate cyclo-ligase
MVSTTRALPDVAALDVADAKHVLRTHFRQGRRARPAREIARLAEDLAQTALDAARGARCVAAYVSRPTEPGTLPLLAALHERGVRVLLPILGPGLSRGWAEYRGGEDLAERAPGRPLEPSTSPSGAETLAEADVVITPALAVDSAGCRLGQGGGWYDRALRHARPEALVIATVYDDEVVEGLLPRDEHDVPVDAVLTPSRWWAFSPA